MNASPNAILPARSKQITLLQTLIAGLTKQEQALPTLLIHGQSYQATDLIPILQARLDAAMATVTAKASWQSTVKADYAQRDSTKALVSGLRQALLVAFGGKVDALADFGLVGRKPPVVSPATQVAAAQKARATRAARHTMGSKQRAAIKGDVASSAVTSSPPANGAATAASAQPTATVAAPPAPTAVTAQPAKSGS